MDILHDEDVTNSQDIHLMGAFRNVLLAMEHLRFLYVLVRQNKWNDSTDQTFYWS